MSLFDVFNPNVAKSVGKSAELMRGKPFVPYEYDYSDRDKVVADLEAKYGVAPTGLDDAGKAQLGVMEADKLSGDTRTQAGIRSNTATTKGISNLIGGDSLSGQNIDRTGLIGSLEADRGSTDRFSQMKSNLLASNLADQERRYFDVNTEVLPNIEMETADIQNRVKMAQAQAAARANAQNGGIFSKILGIGGGVVGGIYGGSGGAMAGSAAGSAVGGAVT